MALRSIKTPTLISPAGVSSSSSSIVIKSQSFKFASKPTATLTVINRNPSFYSIGSILKLKSASPAAKFRCSSSALTPQLRDTLEKLVNSEKVVLFMKGTRDFPMCGFSNTVVQILKNLNVPFEDVNILENEMLRQGLKEVENCRKWWRKLCVLEAGSIPRFGFCTDEIDLIYLLNKSLLMSQSLWL
ncbi:Monothiol glutaredoxin-S14 [Cardamine amara subsp. amara]|uniref:Monothiol glutaredoxin-S14 n=1 Tax=Cardamine amara subsp. amara TaxID=228776 RepID=A0ABD1BWY2_CARAN